MIKIDHAFVDEWHRRYTAACEAGELAHGVLRNEEGCMCALGIGYNMLVEVGVGEWVRHGSYYRFKCPELKDFDTGNTGGFQVLLGLELYNGSLQPFLRMMRFHDQERHIAAACAILEIKNYVDAQSLSFPAVPYA